MTNTSSIRLYDLDLPVLERLLVRWGADRASARAVWRVIYRDAAVGVDQMTGLAPSLRSRLAAEVPLYVPTVLAREEAPDGETRKDLLEMEDGQRIEVVLLRYRDRRSACVSTQLGCACGCCFCATGQSGLVRQLSSGEIVAQVLHLQRELAARGERLSNLVLMGMGEPLLNYDETIAAIRRLADPRGMGFVQRRMTLSTVGIPPGIRRLAHEDLRIRLAVSLHAATDDLRDELVPINRRHRLDELFAAMREYVVRTGQRIMLEWVLIDEVNDTPQEAQALVDRLDGLAVHVNLIRLNQTQGYTGRASDPAAIDAFSAVLDRVGVPHTLRQRRGGAIAAGCGQLRRRNSPR